MHRSTRPGPSMIVAMVALVVALGGTATAASVLITSSGQIKDGAVKRPDLGRDVINGSRIQDGSINLRELGKDVTNSVGSEAYEAFRAGGPIDVGANESAVVATLTDLPPGAYAITAKTVLTAPSNKSAGLIGQGQSIGGHCELDTAGDTDNSYALLGAPGALAPSELSLQLLRNFSTTGSAKLTCDVTQETWRASNTSIIAIRLSGATRSNVDE